MRLKYNPLVDALVPKAAFMLGMVISAHSNRAFCRANCTLAMAAKEAAQKALDTEGMDVKWFNEQALASADGAAHESLRAKIASEKYYRKQRLDFLADFPNLAPTLEEMIPGSTQDFQAKAA